MCSGDCGPPPVFSLPPPPRPPFLQDEDNCSEQPLLPYEHCYLGDAVSSGSGDADLPVAQPLSQATLVAAVCCALLLVAVLVATALLWKYRRKIPCKSAGGEGHDGYCSAAVGAAGPQGGGAAASVEYADLREILPPSRTAAALNQVLKASSPRAQTRIPRTLQQLQDMPQTRPSRRLLDQKATLCPDYQQPSDLYNPVYVEVSNSSEEYTPPSERGGEDVVDADVDVRSCRSSSEASEGLRTYCSAEHLSPQDDDVEDLEEVPLRPSAPPAAGDYSLRYQPSAPPIYHLTDESDSGYSHNTSSGQRRTRVLF